MPDKGYVTSTYLTKLGAVLQHAKRRSYERLHIAPGARVLDVACGPGTDTIPLAEIVGSRGFVAGVDRDPAMIEQANTRAAHAGVAAWTEHRAADAAELPYPDASFDAVRADRLFQHLKNPLPAFDEMVRVLRPGGMLAVLDTDYASSSVALDERALERRFVRVVLEHSIHNGYAAREMAQLLNLRGLSDVDWEFFPVVYTDYNVARELGRWDEIERIAQELDLLNQDEINHLHASAERAQDEGSFLLHVDMIMTVGIKT